MVCQTTPNRIEEAMKTDPQVILKLSPECARAVQDVLDRRIRELVEIRESKSGLRYFEAVELEHLTDATQQIDEQMEKPEKLNF